MNGDKLPFVLKGAGRQEKQCQMNRTSGFPYHQLIFSLSGSGLLAVGDNKFEVEANQVIYLKSDEPHRYSSRAVEWETGWLIFSGAHINETMMALGYETTGIFEMTPVINRLFKEVLNMKGHDMNNILLSYKMYEILALLIQPNADQKVPDSIQLIIDLIQIKFKDPLTLDILAEWINVTPQYLCKRFKEVVSVTPIEYLKNRRMEVAKELLLNTQLSIKEIAVSVGYNDNSYFSSLFKKYEGVTATVYRGY